MEVMKVSGDGWGPTAEQLTDWEQRGFFILPGFWTPASCEAMLDRAVEIARAAGESGVADGAIAESGVVDGAIVHPENNLLEIAGSNQAPEAAVSKIFRLARDPLFHEFATTLELVAIVRSLLSPAIDCFLSQFIFKNPGAWGQPWHQDSYYFPFDRTPQVGVWLAVTEATLENGCLHVMPGSHREPVHEHVPDSRPGANRGYVEITGHDTDAAVSVTMRPGDLLIFHSHLMHRSTDNRSDQIRAAMVYHYAERGTTDQSEHPAIINDWMAISDQVNS